MLRPAILLILLQYASLLAADIPGTLEKTRHLMTHYLHTLLRHVDDTIDCDANCTHPEIARVRRNSLHLITSLKSTEANRLSASLNLRGNIYLPKLSKKFRITFVVNCNNGKSACIGGSKVDMLIFDIN